MTDFFAAAHVAQTIHGEAKRGAWSPTYRAWRYMRDRVARDPGYKHVTICERWNSYAAFKEDMGDQPPGMTLDRVNGSWVYSPSTCKWSTPVEQANNTARNVLVTLRGKTQTLAQWVRELDLNYRTIHNRINACGWSAEKALTTPHRGWNKQGRL